MSDTEHKKQMTLELAQRSPAQVISESGVLIFIAVIGFLGNSCVLCVFYKSSRLRSVTNYYLIVLAVSDIAMTTVVMPTTIAVAVTGRDVLGFHAGQTVGFITYVLVFGSLQTTTLIAVNRFFCITKPSMYRKYFKPKPATVMIIGAWLFSLSNTAVIYCSGMGTYTFHPGMFVYFLAFSNLTNQRISAAFNQLTCGIIPMILTAFCYWKVYKAVKTHNATMSQNLNNDPNRNGPSMAKEDIDVTKSVLALVIGFVLCWLPCGTVYHVNAYMNLSRYAEMFMTYTAYTSSAINPFLFYTFNNPFKREFANIFFPKRSGRVGVIEGRTNDN